MQAAGKIKPGPGIDVFQMVKPKPGTKDVLIRVKNAAICGTDRHFYQWTEFAQRSARKFPIVLGHEVAGEVVEVGKNVETVKVGDRVTAETHFPCGKCYMCRTDRMHICMDWKLVAGSFAEYEAVPEFCAIKLPDKISYEEGAVLEPLGVAMHTVQRASIKPGDIVVVTGDGPIGIWAQKLAKMAGASMVVATGHRDFRLKLSKSYAEATEVIDVKKMDPVERVKELTGGKKADIVIELTGRESGIKSALDMVGRGGRVVMAGIAAKPMEMPLTDIFYTNEIDLLGVSGRLIFETWERVLRLVSAKLIDVKPIITHKLPLAKAPEAFELVEKGDVAKVQLLP